MNINCFPRAGTVVLEAIYRSRPAALGDPRVGDRACVDSFTRRSRDEKEAEEDMSIMRIPCRSRNLSTALSQCKLRIDMIKTI